jgi:hypothetical protein
MLPHKKINILVVDDELSIRIFVRVAGKRSGVETAPDGLSSGQKPGKSLTSYSLIKMRDGRSHPAQKSWKGGATRSY